MPSVFDPFEPFQPFRFVAQGAAPGPLLTFDFTDGILESGQTLGRLSTAYHEQPTGLQVLAASGEARWAGMTRVSQGVYTGTALGLLMEPVSINLLTYSQDWSSGGGQGLLAFGSGSTVNATTAPDGSETADLIVEDSSTGPHRRYGTLLIDPGAYTFTVFVKAKERTKGQVSQINATPTPTVNFDLTAAIVSGAVNCTATIEERINGWYAISITATHTAGRITTYPQVMLANAAGSLSYAGDGASGMYVWQRDVCQQGFRSSIIPTTTAAVTRAKETLAITGVPADNETRITFVDGVVDIDDFDPVTTPLEVTYPRILQTIQVYAPGGRPA